ncbi:helix-turn-helix transcriptional regulator [Anaerocolumna sp. AGMB13020]|uniref:helix-turn-helix transcriptional regulator n=1 Tax=Anaerocolumna sp. AGMB13020 TaxID=3081750 RepID=UPI0029550ACF|nr:helix-turn-helix transcriptional regulator [Anaerocolumna sp. AGMB13020]WOO37082.1 helix-turn-helix transcriptional regulator [Anaerocolumna sp. AGMB13020]
MISQENIEFFQGITLCRGNDFINLSPHHMLKPYISCYTISSPIKMSKDYTILPTASSTIVISVSTNKVSSSLRGVNTKACNVGEHANRMKLLLLIEFHSGCLYPFIHANQNDLIDNSFELYDIDKTLAQAIESELIKSECIEDLVEKLDKIFITRLSDFRIGNGIAAMTNKIFMHNGNISIRDLSMECCYSEKHIRRLFLQYVGVSPKSFSRIVRVNYALRLLQNNPTQLIDTATQAGFFDQPHFNHDFKMICGLSPKEYIQNISLFYNDVFKM